jgi:HPt (histidine-containing phosphotransfer) domain-containing protein
MRTDLSYLKAMTEGDKSLILELIGIFSTQVEEYMELMQKHLDEQNWTELSKLAHKAKSTVAIMGMKKLSNELRQLELLAKNGENPETYAETIETFKTECREAVRELQLYK